MSGHLFEKLQGRDGGHRQWIKFPGEVRFTGYPPVSQTVQDSLVASGEDYKCPLDLTVGELAALRRLLHESMTPALVGANVSGSLVNDWFSAMKHIIGPVETSLVVVRSVWHQHLVSKRCIYFCDNYGAIDAFIKGSSSNSDIRKLLLCFEQLECNGSHWPWFSRVPSTSNCADDPTRVGHVLGSFLRGAVT